MRSLQSPGDQLAICFEMYVEQSAVYWSTPHGERSKEEENMCVKSHSRGQESFEKDWRTVPKQEGMDYCQKRIRFRAVVLWQWARAFTNCLGDVYIYFLTFIFSH